MRPPTLAALLLLSPACSEEAPPDPPEPTPTVQLDVQALAPCLDPVPSPGGFLDGLPASGVNFVHSIDPRRLLVDQFTVDITGGLVLADLDGDGATDLLLTGGAAPNALYWGRGDGSFEAADLDRVAAEGSWTTAASAADFDGDGRLDLLLLFAEGGRLLRNLGERRFEQWGPDRGMDLGDELAVGGAFGDYDGDGDLDLYVVRHAAEAVEEHGGLVVSTFQDSLFRNDGERFEDVSEQLPWPGHDGAGIQALWRDLDRDGDLDLIVVNDFAEQATPTALWENLGPGEDGVVRWADRLPGSGIVAPNNAMGLAWTDLDGDGFADWVISDIDGLFSYRGLAGDPWAAVDVGLAWNLRYPVADLMIYWSLLDLDLDGDGRRDLLVTTGGIIEWSIDAEGEWPNTADDKWRQPDLFFWQDPAADQTHFLERGGEVFPVPLDNTSRGIARSDLNGDGVPDVVLQQLGEQPAILLGRCTANRRLVVRLRDEGSRNRFAVGAVVTVEAGGRSQRRDVLAGSRAPYSGSDPWLYFGLGTAARIDSLQVRWPDGRIDRWSDVPAHSLLEIRRPAGL